MQKLYGLIGQKLGHSFSKRYFTEKFEKEGISARYELFELAHIGLFSELLRSQPDLEGVNVTIPYKTEVIPFLNELSSEAQAVGAVNTIRIFPNRLIGHNTDVYGFRESLLHFLKGEKIEQALILGTGGAARAVSFVLQQQLQIRPLFVSRNPSGPQQINYTQLDDLPLDDFRLIVNTTPLGMYPQTDACPEFPFSRLQASHYAFDLIYNPEETLFLKQAATHKAKIQNGMEMLILQAEGAWEIWNSNI